MLNDAAVSQFKKVYLAPGYTDLRRGIDGLASIVRFQFELDPYDKNTLFLFCGRKNSRIKALLWEGDGFLLMYKRLDNGSFRWPRSADEAMAITDDQYRMLMQGLEGTQFSPFTLLQRSRKSCFYHMTPNTFLFLKTSYRMVLHYLTHQQIQVRPPINQIFLSSNQIILLVFRD